MNELSQLTAIPGVVTSRGATVAEFDAFESRTGLTLPPDVRRLYEHTNGLVIDRSNRVKIHSLEEVASFVESFREFGIPSTWGYFPFTDRNDSNPHCVCCAGPATSYVVRVNHDDIARIEYRSVGSFLAAVRSVLEMPEGEEDGGPSLWNLPQDFYPHTSDRTAEDVATAHRLLTFAGPLEEGSVERADSERWAITLFSENEVGDVARLLDIGDEYRREEAITNLTAMTTPEARTAIERHRREVNEFTRDVVAALKEAGLTVAEVSRGCPRLEPGCVWLNIPMFFTHRRRPTILADIVQRAQELMTLKTQGNA